MRNYMLSERQRNVKVGDRVSVFGNPGVVTEVIHGIGTDWNGKEYAEVPGTEYTNVRVHFTGTLNKWGQYQDGVYGMFSIVQC